MTDGFQMIGDIRPGPGWRLREDDRYQNPTNLDTFRRTNAEYVRKKIGARRTGEFDDQLQELASEKRLGRVLGPIPGRRRGWESRRR